MSERLRTPHNFHTSVAPTWESLRRDHERKPHRVRNAQILQFYGLPPGFNVYNPGPMFLNHDGLPTFLARVEHEDVNSLKDSSGSEIRAFTQRGNAWFPDGVRIPGIEDLAYKEVTIEGVQRILSWGVRVGLHPEYQSVGKTYYNEYRLADRIEDIPDAPVIARSPPDYKDGTVVQLPDESFRIYPRPQGKLGERGQVRINDFKELNDLETAIQTARPLEGLKDVCDGKMSWGAITYAEALSNGLIVFLGHPANYINENGKPVMDGPMRDYAVMSGVMDPDGKILRLGIDLTREDLPPVIPKFIPGHHSLDLDRVLFATSRTRLSGGWAGIMGGIGDAGVFYAEVPDVAEGLY